MTLQTHMNLAPHFFSFGGGHSGKMCVKLNFV